MNRPSLSSLTYALTEIRDHYDDSSWWRGRILERVVGPYSEMLHPELTDGIDIMAAEWDNLIVLDGCRADLFEAVVSVDGFDQYRRVTSRGSATGEWTRENFAGKTFGDTVYVTGNPHTSRVAGDSFHELVEVWKTDFDDDLGTVHAAPILRRARDALDRHPDKRLIVHLMQPHHPFITRPAMRDDGWNARQNEDGSIEANSGPTMTPFKALRDGLLDKDAVKAAYRENLEAVLDDVLEFASDLPGRTVLTADHGNAFGERVLPLPVRIYGHPPNIRLESLVRVPWAVLDGPRREIVPGEIESVDRASEVATERLAALGYAEPEAVEEGTH